MPLPCSAARKLLRTLPFTRFTTADGPSVPGFSDRATKVSRHRQSSLDRGIRRRGDSEILQDPDKVELDGRVDHPGQRQPGCRVLALGRVEIDTGRGDYGVR